MGTPGGATSAMNIPVVGSASHQCKLRGAAIRCYEHAAAVDSHERHIACRQLAKLHHEAGQEDTAAHYYRTLLAHLGIRWGGAGEDAESGADMEGTPMFDTRGNG